MTYLIRSNIDLPLFYFLFFVLALSNKNVYFNLCNLRLMICQRNVSLSDTHFHLDRNDYANNIKIDIRFHFSKPKSVQTRQNRRI